MVVCAWCLAMDFNIRMEISRLNQMFQLMGNTLFCIAFWSVPFILHIEFAHSHFLSFTIEWICISFIRLWFLNVSFGLDDVDSSLLFIIFITWSSSSNRPFRIVSLMYNKLFAICEVGKSTEPKDSFSQREQ